MVARWWRRGEGVEPSGDSISRQAGFEDRWGHRAPSSSNWMISLLFYLFQRVQLPALDVALFPRPSARGKSFESIEQIVHWL